MTLDAAPRPAEPAEPVDAAFPAGAVVLTLAAGRYAADMGCVAEVVVVPPLTPLPRFPGWLAGLINWRGRVLPVVDLRPLLGLPGHPLTTAARIVVLSHDGVEVGVLGESVPGVLPGGGPLEALPGEAGAGYVTGTVDTPAGPVAVVSVPAVVRLRERVLPFAA